MRPVWSVESNVYLADEKLEDAPPLLGEEDLPDFVKKAQSLAHVLNGGQAFLQGRSFFAHLSKAPLDSPDVPLELVNAGRDALPPFVAPGKRGKKALYFRN